MGVTPGGNAGPRRPAPMGRRDCATPRASATLGVRKSGEGCSERAVRGIVTLLFRTNAEAELRRFLARLRREQLLSRMQ